MNIKNVEIAIDIPELRKTVYKMVEAVVIANKRIKAVKSVLALSDVMIGFILAGIKGILTGVAAWAIFAVIMWLIYIEFRAIYNMWFERKYVKTVIDAAFVRACYGLFEEDKEATDILTECKDLPDKIWFSQFLTTSVGKEYIVPSDLLKALVDNPRCSVSVNLKDPNGKYVIVTTDTEIVKANITMCHLSDYDVDESELVLYIDEDDVVIKKKNVELSELNVEFT